MQAGQWELKEKGSLHSEAMLRLKVEAPRAASTSLCQAESKGNQ